VIRNHVEPPADLFFAELLCLSSLPQRNLQVQSGSHFSGVYLLTLALEKAADGSEMLTHQKFSACFRRINVGGHETIGPEKAKNRRVGKMQRCTNKERRMKTRDQFAPIYTISRQARRASHK
jgi:hypothetical protein